MTSLLSKNIFPLLILVPVFLLIPELVHADWSMQGMVWFVVSGVFGKFMVFAGWLLDIGISDYVIGFGKKYTTEGVGVAIDLVWESIRDIFNITFIFGLVYIGFKMILNSDDSRTRQWLVHIILAALLVNFSLFFTKFTIDLSNTLATQIAVSGFVLDSDGNPDVSDTFMNSMGITSTLNFHTKDITDGGGWGYIFGSMILFIVTTFAFGAGAFMLLIRFVALLLYMALSPLMFIGWVLPQLQRYTNEYWSGFLGRAFFAPIYILMLYISSQVLAKFFNNTKSDFAALFAGDGAAAELTFSATLPPFIIASIFLIASVVIAQKMGAHGASAAISTGKNLSRKFRRGVQRGAGNLVVGGTARVGRKVFGGVGQGLVDNPKVQAMARRNGMFGLLGKGISGTANYARNASFDARNVGGLGEGLGIGKGKKGGRVQDMKDKAKKEKERAERYSSDDNDQFYKDAGTAVEKVKRAYDNVLKNLDDTISELSEIPIDENPVNQQKRRDKTDEITTLKQNKQDIEKNTNKIPAIDTFNNIRKNNRQMQKNEYAANLERRGDNLPRGLRQVYQHVLTDKQANLQAAAEVRKEVTPTDRLIDALKNSQNQAPSPAPEPKPE